MWMPRAHLTLEQNFLKIVSINCNRHISALHYLRALNFCFPRFTRYSSMHACLQQTEPAMKNFLLEQNLQMTLLWHFESELHLLESWDS